MAAAVAPAGLLNGLLKGLLKGLLTLFGGEDCVCGCCCCCWPMSSSRKGVPGAVEPLLGRGEPVLVVELLTKVELGLTEICSDWCWCWLLLF